MISQFDTTQNSNYKVYQRSEEMDKEMEKINK